MKKIIHRESNANETFYVWLLESPPSSDSDDTDDDDPIDDNGGVMGNSNTPEHPSDVEIEMDISFSSGSFHALFFSD